MRVNVDDSVLIGSHKTLRDDLHVLRQYDQVDPVLGKQRQCASSISALLSAVIGVNEDLRLALRLLLRASKTGPAFGRHYSALRSLFQR